jgi:LacI family transcriptional regulator
VGYIEENFTRDLTIGALTRLVPLSRRSLEIKFKEEMDVSIYQFILHRRIEHLADLLLTTDHPLFDLAVQSGINDYKNISRIFKKFKIFPPHEFRRKFRSVIPERPILNVT